MSDLVQALKDTPEEVMLVAEMTVGQQDNPLWMDARQWRITASNFGRITNRQTEDYPLSLLKLLLGDYGCPISHVIRWGIEHPSFYQTFKQTFICLVHETPGGRRQLHVHANYLCLLERVVAALLLSLAEVTQTACTSLLCTWSYPSTHASHSKRDSRILGRRRWRVTKRTLEGKL